MNADGALQLLDRSKAKYKEGDNAAAIRIAKRSLTMHETPEAKVWLDFLLSKAPAPTSTPPPKSSEPSNPQAAGASDKSKQSELRNRKSQPAASSSSASSAADSRPFTPEQVSAIKRIKDAKASGNLYAVLGLEKDCSDSDVKRAYRKLALQFHPDKCSAPGTDDAFKAIGAAFAVLSDKEKRSNYDRFGVDSSSSTASGARQARNPFAGAGGFADGDEIDPAELFNMFFGQMAAHQGGAAGPGFRFNVHGGDPFNPYRRRRNHQHDGQREQAGAGGMGIQFLQLLPFILMLLLSLSSSFLSVFSDGGQGLFAPDYQSYYSLGKSYKYSKLRHTKIRRVPYYVSARFEQSQSQSDQQRSRLLDGIEESAEREYVTHLQKRCWREREAKQSALRTAQGWLTGSKERLAAARAMETNSCTELSRFS
ncbi:MAG: hypothetical protein SGCHY_003727 [Lobulomycetales sp.]